MLSNAGLNTHSNRTTGVELKEGGKDSSLLRKIEKLQSDREKYKLSTESSTKKRVDCVDVSTRSSQTSVDNRLLMTNEKFKANSSVTKHAHLCEKSNFV
jgi:hypothetical protein